MDIDFSSYVKESMKKPFLFLAVFSIVAVIIALVAILFAHNNKQSDYSLFFLLFGTIILFIGVPSSIWYIRCLLLLSNKSRFFVTVNSKGIIFRTEPYGDRVYIPWQDVKSINKTNDDFIAFMPSGEKTGQVKDEVFREFYQGKAFVLPNRSDKSCDELIKIFIAFKNKQ